MAKLCRPSGSLQGRSLHAASPLARPAAAARCVDSATFWFAGLIAVVPLLASSVPPFFDYPGHLARVAIVNNILHGGFFEGLYQLNCVPVPNLAFDFAALAFMQVLSPYAAGIATLVLIQAVTLGGVAALSRAIHGRVQLTALLAAVFINNWILLFGFMSYLAGLGVVLFAVAAYLRNERRSLGRQSLSIAVFVVMLYLCHLIAVGLYSIIVVCLMLQELVRDGVSGRSRAAMFAARAAPLAVPPALYLATYIYRVGSPNPGAELDVSDWSELAFNIGYKIKVVWETILSGNLHADLLALVVLSLALILILMRGSVSIDRRFLLPIGVIAVLSFAVPFRVSGAANIDIRLPIAAVYVTLAATSIYLPRLSARLLRHAFLVLIASRALVFLGAWSQSANAYHQMTAALDKLPRHATLYMATGAPFPCPGYGDAARRLLWAIPAGHFHALASIEREIFVPDIWDDPMQHLILRKQQFLPAYDQTFGAENIVDEQQVDMLISKIREAVHDDAVPDGPVYLITQRPDLMRERRLPLPVVAAGDDFAIYRVSPGTRSARVERKN